jgi:hypothetical protein
MNSFAAILFASVATLAPLLAQNAPDALAPEQQAKRTRLLLDGSFEWRKQSGVWKVDGGTVAATADGTLSEYAASSGIAIIGGWLSVRITLDGESAKGGLWLAGLRDDRGDIVRLTIDSASSAITNGRGRTIANLPDGATEKPVDLLLKFAGDTMLVLAGGAQIGALPVKYEEQTATLSLVAERGRTTFSDIVLGAPEKVAPLSKKAAPAKVAPARKVAAKALSKTVDVDFTGEKMTELKGGWTDYFGVHTEISKGPWKTVRQFDGPAIGLPTKPTLASKRLDGPFNKVPVEMNLSWFREPVKRNALGLDQNLATISSLGIDAVYIAPWRSMLGKSEQDQIWALLKLAYSAHPAAEKHLFFQWGDDINSQRLGTSPDSKTIVAAPRNGVLTKRNVNLPPDAAAYAENYFAPAVEALRKASIDVFGDVKRIPVIVGSCARAGRDDNRDWYRTVLEHTISGELAPSLTGRKVIDLADYLTVNYPFADAANTKSLQSLWNDYGKRIKGLWITEEFGSTSQNAGQLAGRVGLFFEFVAANNLSPEQTRLIWNFGARKMAVNDGEGLMLSLGERMNGALRFGSQALDGGTLYRISSGTSKLLLIFAPASERKGIKVGPVGELAVEIGEDRAKDPWLARTLAMAGRRGTDEIVPHRIEGSRVVLSQKLLNISPWALLLETP